MPIYQYKCSDCGHLFDALQKMSDAKLVDCPECGLPSLRKQLTAAAFKLNGTGWYETDFKNSGAKPASKTSDKQNDSDTDGSQKSADGSQKSADGSQKSADGCQKSADGSQKSADGSQKTVTRSPSISAAKSTR